MTCYKKARALNVKCELVFISVTRYFVCMFLIVDVLSKKKLIFSLIGPKKLAAKGPKLRTVI